jgi:hypothetical protein
MTAGLEVALLVVPAASRLEDEMDAPAEILEMAVLVTASGLGVHCESPDRQSRNEGAREDLARFAHVMSFQLVVCRRIIAADEPMLRRT